MTRFPTGFALLLTLIAGCAQPCRTDSSVLEIDPATDNPIAVRMVYDDHIEIVVCQRPWTVWMEWTESSRIFRLYDRASRTMTATDNFDLFLSRLAALPRNIEIECLDTCSASHAMPKDAWQRMAQVMTTGGREWAFDELSEQDRRILCTCECRRLEFPQP